MIPGDKVRLIDNPGRIGRLSNETDGPPGPRQRVLVSFFDGTESFFYPRALEKVDANSTGPYDRIRNGSFGRADDLRGLITNSRLSGKLANLIYSLNTTNTDFYAYQFKPVLQFLDSPSNGILIADEVGLGKTIEAGLIWTELRAREDARRLLVICPAMLRDKWLDELMKRFGVKAKIVDAGELLDGLNIALRHPLDGFAYISSFQGLRPPRGWDKDEDGRENPPPDTKTAQLARFLNSSDQLDSLFDLVIVDEAHYLRNANTQAHKFVRLLRKNTQNMVMLSATPIQLRNRDLFNLVNILDEESFQYEGVFDWTLRANAPIIKIRDQVRRSVITQEEFKAALDNASTGLYKNSEQYKNLSQNPPDDETLASPRGRAEVAEQLDRLNPLGKIITRTLKADVQENRVVREPLVIKAKMTSYEKKFYDQVTYAVRDYCADRDAAEGFLLTIPQRQMSSCMAAACQGWQKYKPDIQEDGLEEMIYELDSEIDFDLDVGKKGSLLKQLHTIALEFGNHRVLRRNDSKYRKLHTNLKNYWAQHPRRKVVLFSFYKGTLYYLQERLQEDGINAVVLHGGMNKQKRIEDFRSVDGPDILLSSEVAAEGVDLQFSSLLINFDLPWNPAKIEKRIGRIDRIGQEAPRILIWNFVYEDTIDDRVYDRLLQRLNIFQHALGNMEAILGDQIRTLSMYLLSHKLTPEQEQERIDRSKVAIETMIRQEQHLEKEASNLIAHGDFIQNKVRAANELGRYIRGEDLNAYVHDFLLKHYPGTQLLSNPSDSSLYTLKFSVDAKIDFEEFIREQHLDSKTALLATQAPQILFDNKLRHIKPGIENVSQDHPLVRFISEKIKKLGGDTGYFSVSAVQCSAELLPNFQRGIYVYLVMRWSFSGTREIERLEYISIFLHTEEQLDSLESEQLVSIASLAGQDWLSAKGELDTERVAQLQDECRAELEERYRMFVDNQKREDTDIMNYKIQTLEVRKKEISERMKEKKSQLELSKKDDKNRRSSYLKGFLNKSKNSLQRLDERIEQYKRRNEKNDNQDILVSTGVIKLI